MRARNALIMKRHYCASANLWPICFPSISAFSTSSCCCCCVNRKPLARVLSNSISSAAATATAAAAELRLPHYRARARVTAHCCGYPHRRVKHDLHGTSCARENNAVTWCRFFFWSAFAPTRTRTRVKYLHIFMYTWMEQDVHTHTYL